MRISPTGKSQEWGPDRWVEGSASGWDEKTPRISDCFRTESTGTSTAGENPTPHCRCSFSEEDEPSYQYRSWLYAYRKTLSLCFHWSDRIIPTFSVVTVLKSPRISLSWTFLFLLCGTPNIVQFVSLNTVFFTGKESRRGLQLLVFRFKFPYTVSEPKPLICAVTLAFCFLLHPQQAEDQSVESEDTTVGKTRSSTPSLSGNWKWASILLILEHVHYSNLKKSSLFLFFLIAKVWSLSPKAPNWVLLHLNVGDRDAHR